MDNIVTEQLGLAAVHKACAEMSAVWRATSANDLGIDGQIEFLEQGTSVSTGLICAAQVKSGASYFRDVQNDAAVIYPGERKREYWSKVSLPVLLILHHPDKALTIYADVKPQLGSDGGIRVPLNSSFNGSARQPIMDIAERYGGAVTEERVVERLRNARYPAQQNTHISGIEFLLACASLEHGYFEIRKARLYPLFELAQGTGGVSLGQ